MKTLIAQCSPASSKGWWIWRVCLLLAALAIIVYGIFARSSVPPWPWIAPDSLYYLSPSVNGGIYGIGPRTFVYPMFCRWVMHGTPNLAALTIAQRLLGFVGPTSLFLGWLVLGGRIWKSPMARSAHESLGLLLLLLLVPSTISIIYEQQVLLECLNAFFQCCLGALLCLLWIPQPPSRRRVLACATAGLGILMYYGNPRWGAAAPSVVLLATLAVISFRDPARRWLIAALPVLLTAAITNWSLGFVQQRIVARNPWNDSFTAKVLLWLHADLAANEFRRDLAAPVPPKDAPLLRRLTEMIDSHITARGASGWRTKTFNPDALIYSAGGADALLTAAFPNDPDGYRRFCLHYYWRIVWHQPKAYWGEVWLMLGDYYACPAQDGAFREEWADVAGAVQGSARLAHYLAENIALPKFRIGLEKEAAEMEKPLGPEWAFYSASWMQVIVGWVHQLFLPVTLAGLMGTSAVLISPRLRANRAVATLAWVCLGSILVLFAQVLTLAMVTVTSGRYSDALRPLAVFSLVCSLAIGGSLAIGLLANLGRGTYKPV